MKSLMEASNAELEARTYLVKSLESFVEGQLHYFAPVERIWQPSDFLPDFSSENDELNSFREKSKGLSKDVLVVLIGDMITEEALPTYQTGLNRVIALKDETGAGITAWAKASKWWTAEENRHGDLLNAYLRLNPNVNMRAVEITVQHLIRNGFNPRTGNDPYNSLVYTSFQERATKISHGNVAELASRDGDSNLSNICRKISGDETRHESFYKAVFSKVCDEDPKGALIALKTMMERKIVMPAELMSDGKDLRLYEHFSLIAQKLEVYTVQHYADMIEHFVSYWNIAARSVSGEAAKAQEYLCTLGQKYRRLAERNAKSIMAQPIADFSWIKA